MNWLIREIHGAFYTLISDDFKEQQLAVLRGRHRIDREVDAVSGIPFRNPLCVGDQVEVQIEHNQYVIESVKPRRNIILRSSPNEIHALGSNIDRALVVVSLKQPPLRTGFIDRFLLSARHGGVSVSILFTKADLIDITSENDRNIIKLIGIYKDLGIPCYIDNVLQPGNWPGEACSGWISKNSNNGTDEPLQNIDTLLTHLKGSTLLCGPSGAGKSTFTNLIVAHSNQRTKATSQSSGKGRHTTTSSQLFPLENGAILIDTPGIKEWGLAHLSRKVILETMHEFEGLNEKCQYRNCGHLPGTDGCAILAAMTDGILPASRQKSLDLILEERHQRIRPGDYKKPTGRLRVKGNS